MNAQPTCEQRIDSHLADRLTDLRVMFYGPTIDDIQLLDDGTLDTVIQVLDREFRFSDTSQYRGYQIEDDDYVIQSPPFKKYYCKHGSETFEHADIDDMIKAIARDMRKNEYFPNVWFISDHGNESLLSAPCLFGGNSINLDTVNYTIVDNDPTLDLEALFDDERLSIANSLYADFHDYGLCFDYVEPNTFSDQEQAYFRYQLSDGGPSDEFRFYVNPDLSCYYVEYVFLDWFDGATLELTGDDKALLIDIYNDFRDCGTIEHLLNEAKS